MKCLLDGDVIAYMCGFASDKAAKDYSLEAEPVENALNGVKMTVDAIVEAVDAGELAVFLTGKGNFRQKVYPEYKANRKDAPRPYHYEAIRKYLVNRFDAKIVDGEEADDAMGRAQATAPECSTVICSTDKDMNMIAGWHYNFHSAHREKGMYFVKPIDGLRLFYKQMITGDTTDNIPGIYAMFKKKATKEVLGVLDEMKSERLMYNYVKEDVYNGDYAKFERQAQLLWIRSNQTWEEHEEALWH